MALLSFGVASTHLNEVEDTKVAPSAPLRVVEDLVMTGVFSAGACGKRIGPALAPILVQDYLGLGTWDPGLFGSWKPIGLGPLSLICLSVKFPEM